MSDFDKKQFSTKDLVVGAAVALVLVAGGLGIYKYIEVRHERDQLLLNQTTQQPEAWAAPVQQPAPTPQPTANDRAPEDEQTVYMDPPGIVVEDDAPAGVKEVEQRHASEDAAGQERSYAPGLAE